MKICTRCHKEKSESEFHIKTHGKLSPECKECHREYVRLHYKNNKNYYLEKAKKQREKTRDWYEKYKASVSCETRGENHPATLDFHHRQPSKKEKCISTMISESSLAAIKREIKKCKVLCSNCHRKLHWEENNKL